MDQISFQTKLVRANDGEVAGTGDTITSATIDMQGYDGVRAICALGAITATGVPTLRVQQGDHANGDDAANITGAVAVGDDTMSDKLLAIDVWRPSHRYITVTLGRATANIVLDDILLEFYTPRTAAVVKDATVAVQTAVTAN